MSFVTQVEGGIAELVIDHPPVNAMDLRGWSSFAAEVERLGRDPEDVISVFDERWCRKIRIE